jgi:hypothetical protein
VFLQARQSKKGARQGQAIPKKKKKKKKIYFYMARKKKNTILGGVGRSKKRHYT